MYAPLDYWPPSMQPKKAINTVLSFNSLITDRNADPEFTKLVAPWHEPGDPDHRYRQTLVYDHTRSDCYFKLICQAGQDSRYRKVHGDVATVWTQTTTESTALNSDKKNTNSFTEVYLLITTVDGWKIAAIADNRQSTKLEAAQN
ncbi:MAG: hypothetical protein QF541_22815 [Lentisphaeria bacterium]|nr:hypothetical protein [Lentisphaeria bacterium]